MHILTYILNEDCDKFHNRITKDLSLFNYNTFYKFEDDNGLEYNVLEGNLFNEEVSINFDGEISIIKLFVKYSRFMDNLEDYERVIVFEKKLIEFLFDTNIIYRVDEGILEDFSKLKGEFWYRKKNAFVNILNYINKQDKLHWSKIKD